jgi:hypothetical protein
MPEKRTKARAARDKAEGKSPSTQAGEYVREEIHHIREGKHGARSSKQAIAIGLSKARRAGVDLTPPKRGQTTERTRKSAERAYARGHGPGARKPPSRRRSRATEKALQKEGRMAATRPSLARQARSSARRRSAADRSQAARKGARTKGPAKRSAAARKAARTRAHHSS